MNLLVESHYQAAAHIDAAADQEFYATRPPVAFFSSGPKSLAPSAKARHRKQRLQDVRHWAKNEKKVQDPIQVQKHTQIQYCVK